MLLALRPNPLFFAELPSRIRQNIPKIHQVLTPPRLGSLLVAVVFLLSHASAALQENAEIYKDPKAPVEKRVEDLLARLTTEEKLEMLSGEGFVLKENRRLGIPTFLMSDASMGVRCVRSTAYANGIGLAATWDADLAEQVGICLGRDSRARGVNFLLGPGMNLYRAPFCGRNFEYLGEDPVLAGEMAARFIQGIQSQGVCATAKHFVANEQEVDRLHLSSNVDERTLRELYLKPFQIVVEKGVLAVMSSYNLINGIHASQNEWLLSEILKKEWGFKGVVMSDWDSCYDAMGMANGGLDIEMPDGKLFNSNNLVPLIEAGKISQATIDDKVRRQLRVAFTLGWLDRPQKDLSIPLDDPASDAMALRGARESITLLKNDHQLLPLDPAKVKKVVLLGRNADPAVMGGSGSALVEPLHSVSVYEGLRSALPSDATIIRIPWKRIVNRNGTKVPEALDANGAEGSPAIPAEYLDEVKSADLVVVCTGFRQAPDFKYYDANPSEFDQEGEGGDRPYQLPPGQEETILAAAKLNPKTVVILNAGGSVATANWINRVGTFLQAYYPGQNGGKAIAEILFGKVNPSGKLPFSWEKKWEDSAAYGNYPDYQTKPYHNTYKEGVFLGYRWFDKKGIAPLFPFGFGLSYTTFSLSGLEVKEGSGGSYTATATVKNVGARSGAEVVQLYITPPEGGEPRPLRELKGFTRTELAPGESKQVTISFNRKDLAYWNPKTKQWTVTPGTYEVLVGSSSEDLPLHAAIQIL
jgi:beta-glucosidase